MIERSNSRAHHLEHGLTGWRGGVDTLLVQEQVDTEGVQLGKPIDAPGHHDIEFAPAGTLIELAKQDLRDPTALSDAILG
jgi:hypothetical protein